MSKLSDAKILGGVGALLALILPFIPYIGPILSIVGAVLILIAVKYIADETKDDKIFKNYLLNFILSIIAVFAGLTVIVTAFFGAGGFSFITGLQSANITDLTSFLEYFGTFIAGCILALIIVWILLIIAMIYLRRSYNSIAEYTKVDLFKTTGLIYFIGAITLVIFIGIIILFIANILEIVSFFSLPDKLPTEAETSKGAGESQRRCPNCVRIIPEDARTCPYCSKKL